MSDNIKCVHCGQSIYRGYRETHILWRTPEDREEEIKELEKLYPNFILGSKESVPYTPGTLHSENLIMIAKGETT